MEALQARLGTTSEENTALRAAAAKAERHLDAYDGMVIRLEDQVRVAMVTNQWGMFAGFATG